jgi:hypothetical protein
MYQYLIVLTIASTAGLQSWRTLFDNFAVHAAHLHGDHVGFIQSVREIPGFLTFLVTYVLLYIREHRLSALSILILGAGVAATGHFPTFTGLVFTTLLFSFGFHYFETTNMSLTLQFFDRSTSPWVFGKQRSLAAATNIAVGAVIYLITPHMNFTGMYHFFGVLIVGAALWAFTKNPVVRQTAIQQRKLIFRRKYGLFYFLTFMAGARRQIFIAFAVFLLVQKFHYTVRDVTILFVINNAVNFFLAPFLGKCIIRFGERKVLSVEYFSLLFIFTAYAFVQSPVIAGALYVLDHLFFNFAIAIRTYFQKVGDPGDVAPTMAMGFAINHVAAVVLPAIGGLLWVIDYRIPFLAGAFFSLISLTAVQFIRTDAKPKGNAA